MRVRPVIAVLIASYLASGWYIVGGDEQAVVRRFGRMSPPLRDSGLHYDLPWPCTRIDRIQLSAVRTLTLGVFDAPGAALLLPERPRAMAFLTGDKNLLALQVAVSYRQHPEHVADFLFRHADVAQRLRLLVESALTEAAAQCGVDYLQTFGLAELSQLLTQKVARLADEAQLGLDVDQVTLERVEPPARVQADFLEVADARAEAAQTLHEARTAAERTISAATAEAEQLRQQARRQSAAVVAQADGKAARFAQLCVQLHAEPDPAARKRVLDLLTRDTLRAALARVATRMVIDSRQPVELHLPTGTQREPTAADQ